MARLPAVCQRCGFAFTYPTDAITVAPGAKGVRIDGLSIVGAGINVSEGAEAEIGDVGAGPCPKCGRDAYYPGGIYTVRDDLLALLKAPDTTLETLREIGLVLVQAAEEGTDSSKVGRQLQGRLPTFVAWMQTKGFKKRVRKVIYAVVLAVLAKIIEQRLYPTQAGTVINVNEAVTQTVNNCVEQMPTQDREKILEDLRHLLESQERQSQRKDERADDADTSPDLKQ